MRSRYVFLFLICIQIAMVACQPKGNALNNFALGESDKSRLQNLDSLITHFYVTDVDSAISYLNKKIDLLNSLKQYATLTEMHLYLTEIYQYRKSDGGKALSSITDAVHVFLDHPGFQIPNIYFFINLGNVLLSNDMNNEAIFAYQQALTINVDQPFIRVLALNNIALCYQQQLSYDSAAYYFRLANQTIPDKKDMMMAQNYNYINTLMVEKGQLDSVKFYHDKVELIVPQIDMKKFEKDKKDLENANLEVSKILAKSDYLMARYFRMVQENGKADSCFRSALNHAKSSGFDGFRADVYFNLAEIKKEMGLPEKALSYADSALQFNLKTNDFKQIISSCELISELHNQLNHASLAKDFQKLSQAWSDSLLNHENSDKLLNAKLYLTSANTKLAFKELRYRQETDSKIISQQKSVIYLLLFIFFLVFFGAIVILAYRKKLATTNLSLARRTMEAVTNEDMLNIFLETKPVNDDLLSQLNHLVQSEKIFLDPNLTLVNLAQKLDTNRTHLSQVFNEHHKVSFNDYINELRVKEACRLLMATTDKNVTIDQILSTSGFSSRTPFYAAFKKFTGVTPEVFKRMNPSQN